MCEEDTTSTNSIIYIFVDSIQIVCIFTLKNIKIKIDNPIIPKKDQAILLL